MVTGQVATSIRSNDDCTRLRYLRLRHTGEKSLQTLTKQGLLKSNKTYKLELCEHCVICKKTKVKFSTAIYYTEGILGCVHTVVWEPTKTASIKSNNYFFLLMISLGDVGYIP